MNKSESVKKRIQPYILIACVAFLVEIFGFNILSYKSLFYDEKMLGEFESWVDKDADKGIASLYVKLNGEKLHEIYLDAADIDSYSGEAESLTATINMQEVSQNGEDGDYQAVIEKEIDHYVPASKYVFMPAAVSSRSIRVDFPIREGRKLRLYDVKINAHKPLFVSWVRLSIILAAGILIWTAISLLVFKKAGAGTKEAEDADLKSE